MTGKNIKISIVSLKIPTLSNKVFLQASFKKIYKKPKTLLTPKSLV